MTNQSILMLALVFWAAIIIFVVLYVRGYKKIVLDIIGVAVEKAEELFTDKGAGEAKLKYVVDKVYQKIPMTVRFFMKEEDLIMWINEAVHYMNMRISEAKKTLK